MRIFPAILSSLLLLSGASEALAQSRADPEAATGFQPKPLVTAQHHMIVAAHPEASRAGLAMLRNGGSAADAAIAALLVLNVVEPQSSGLGGGAFALVRDLALSTPFHLTTFDARETAPADAGPDLFTVDGRTLSWSEAVPTGRSIGTPGLAALLGILHERFGRLPWASLFLPAIRLAENGFPVSPRFAGSVERFADLLESSPAAALFLPRGKPAIVGDTFRNPALARSLRRLALTGPAAFYNGDIAREIVTAARSTPLPGTHSVEDLARYRVVERAPVCMRYGARDICGMGPPSSGATTVGQILGLIAAKGPIADDPSGLHLFAEASRLAYADRARFLGDPDFVEVPVSGMLDPVYLAERARLFESSRASQGAASAGDPPKSDPKLEMDAARTSPGTTHLSVIDRSGLAISLTASIESAYGSKRVAGGFLLNNQLTDFSFSPSVDESHILANAPAGRKRPRSSMAPTMVFRDGALTLALGSPGGSRIPEYVANALIGMLDFGEDPATAAARPHVSHRNRSILTLEASRHDPEAEATLHDIGHEVDVAEMVSGLHILQITDETESGQRRIFGGADPRREGIALGD